MYKPTELPIDTTIKKLIEERRQFTRDLVEAYKKGLIEVSISKINNDLRLEEINYPLTTNKF
tara:strand:+ start:124 stop:309 length:186 start_codon:yes stop_codon:yes gene_type:complete